MALDGTYDTVAKTPLGDQKSALTVKTDGNTWTGSQNGDAGSIEIADGTVEGNTLKWTAKITTPMPMTLTNEATIDGDTLTGTMTAGAFGSFPLTGTRTA